MAKAAQSDNQALLEPITVTSGDLVPEVVKTVEKEYPKSIILKQTYSYYDENNRLVSYLKFVPIIEPDVIKKLIDLGLDYQKV
jgi:hypothetical protein